MADEETKDIVKSEAKDSSPIPLDKDGFPAPRTLEQMYRVGKLFARSQMVPEAYQMQLPNNYEGLDDEKKVIVWHQALNAAAQKITVATMMGREVGLRIMAALRSIAVINGRPSVWGDAIPALAAANAPIEDVKEYYEGSLADKTRTAYCEVKRADRKSWSKASFSVEDAIRAGLWDNSKKQTWIKYPDRMLMMRARQAYKDAVPGATLGLLIAEEAMDMDPVPVQDAVVVEPTFDEMPTDAGLDAHTEAGSTQAEGEPVDAEFEEKAEEETSEPGDVDKNFEVIATFINDQVQTDDDLVEVTSLFYEFTQVLCTFYKQDEATVRATMVEQGMSLTWDKFQEWNNNRLKDVAAENKKAEDLQAKIDAAGAGPKDNVWATGGWKHQGGEKFRTYLTNHLEALKEMPAEFQAQMIDRWHTFNLGDFPSLD